MRISPTIICISIWIAFGLALATGATAQAGDKDKDSVVIILRPGLEKGQIETALDAAKDTGRPVTVRWEDASAPVAPVRLRPPRRRTVCGMPSRPTSRSIYKD